MDVFRQFATDESREVSGVWREIGDGAKVLVARASNRAYVRMLSKLWEQHKLALEANTEASEQLADRLTIDVMAQTILLNWEGITFKGKQLPHSVENAKMLLGVKDFRKLIARLSDDVEQYRVKEEEQAGES